MVVAAAVAVAAAGSSYFEWNVVNFLTDLHTNRWQVSGQEDIT